MGTVKKFEELDAWQTARALSNRLYNLTEEDPFASDLGLRDQIRRAAVSVMSNIAEGFNSRSQKRFIDDLGRARGSAAEGQSHCTSHGTGHTPARSSSTMRTTSRTRLPDTSMG